jgi:hypothetical protein
VFRVHGSRPRGLHRVNELYGSCFSTVNHGGASEPDRDGRTDGLVHGSGRRDRAAKLPVAEERSRAQRRNIALLCDPGNNELG